LAHTHHGAVKNAPQTHTNQRRLEKTTSHVGGGKCVWSVLYLRIYIYILAPTADLLSWHANGNHLYFF